MKAPAAKKSRSRSPVYDCYDCSIPHHPTPPAWILPVSDPLPKPPGLNDLSEEEWAAAEAEQAKKAREFAVERARRDEVRREGLRAERVKLQEKLVEALSLEEGCLLPEDFLSLARHNHREEPDRRFYSEDPCPRCFLQEIKEHGYWLDSDFRLVLQVERIPSDER